MTKGERLTVIRRVKKPVGVRLRIRNLNFEFMAYRRTRQKVKEAK